jgi:hypothetical protein
MDGGMLTPLAAARHSARAERSEPNHTSSLFVTLYLPLLGLEGSEGPRS